MQTNKQIKIDIPAGVQDGTKLRIKGEGKEGGREGGKEGREGGGRGGRARPADLQDGGSDLKWTGKEGKLERGRRKRKREEEI